MTLFTAPWAPKCLVIVALTVLAAWFGTLAKAPVRGGPRSIVCLELAPTVAAAERFFDAWRKEDRWRERLNEAQRWDTWLICTYAPLLALLSWVLADAITPAALCCPQSATHWPVRNYWPAH